MTWTLSNALLRDFENSHSSPELAGESLAVSCLDGGPSAQSNTSPTPAPSCVLGKTTAVLSRSRFGTMFGPLTESHGEAVLTSFLGDFPARTCPPLEREQESPESAADCGLKWQELWVKFNPVSCGWKTHQCLFHEDLDWSLLTLPRWGMMQGGELLERDTPELTTCGKGAGFWPAPLKDTYPGSQSFKLTDAVSAVEGYQMKPYQKNVDTHRKWSRYPTPTCHNAKECDAPSESGRNEPTLTHVARGGDKTLPTRLNPAWVEWLMGWPINWTALNESETANAHKQWLSRGTS